MDFFKAIYEALNGVFTNDQLVYFGSLIALLTALLTFYKNNLKIYVFRFFKWFKYIYNSFEHIEKMDTKFEELKKLVVQNRTIYDDSIEKINKSVDYIEKELSPNSSKSIKDLIDKIVTSMKVMEKVSSSLEYQVKKIESRQWTVMINNNDYPMFETDEKGLCIRANKAYLDLVGLHLDDVLNMGWVNVIFIDDRKIVQNEWESAVQDKRTFDLKYRIQNITMNKVYLIRCISQPYFVDKEIIGYIGKYLVISEMVQDSNGMWVKKTT